MFDRTRANPHGTHPMQRTMAARAVTRARFAAWLVTRLDALGVPHSGRDRFPHTLRATWLAEQLGVGRGSALDWLNGDAVPAVHQLPALAQVLEVDLAQVCTAAGRPPADAARLRFSTDTEGALATVVHRWRASRGLTHAQAAKIVGLSASTLSRLESGARVDLGVPALIALADAFGMTPAELAVACRAVADAPEALDAAAAAPSRPLACTLRRARKAHGLNTRQLALRLQVSAAALASWEKGRSLPREMTLLRLGLLLGVSVARLLREAGYASTTVEAARLADALDVAARMRPHRSFGTSLRAARRSRDVRTYRLAQSLGIDRFQITRYEQGHLRPVEAARVLQIADVLGVRPAPLLAAWARTA